MATVAEHVPFLHLCKLCQKLSEKKSKEKKLRPLKEFLEYWRNFHKKLHASDPNTTDSFFSALRLMLPQCERQRSAYGIKEFTLAKLLIEIFCLDKNSPDAQKLLNYRSPKSANVEAGDFASVAYFVLKNRSPENGSLTIHDVNRLLDNIAENHAGKNKDNLKHDLLHLFRNTAALEQKWLIRMILKDMKLGVSENTVLYTYHSDAKDLYDVTNSLEKVCCDLKDPSVRLHEIEISLFSPFRPMLSEMALPNQVENLMQNNPFVIETKYDGERLQIHKDGSSYMYFSRGGFDCTDTYGSSPLQGSLTPFIHKAFDTGTTSCILDGEIVIYSSKLNCIVSKGENADVQALQPDGDYAPCLCVFDILLMNRRVLSNVPLVERIPFIKRAFKPIENKIRYTVQLTASTNEEVTEELNKAIDSRLEGIVVKNPDSIYKPNKRKGGGWLKVKPEYIENAMEELDLLIIGGYYGEGRRSNVISHFLLAVADPQQIEGAPKCFYSFCKVGSGYTFKELYELSGKLGDHWQPYSPKKPPACLIIGGGRKEQPDVWIEPSKSVILQVKASEINKSKSFSTNCTLRFPRVEKIRYDKPWHDCMTTAELEDLKNLAQGRLATKRTAASEEEESPKKPKLQKDRVVTVAPHFCPTDTSDVQKISELFKDKELCVVFASLDKKREMEKSITQYGGKFVQNPGGQTYCVVCDKTTAKVKNIISTDLYDVVKSDWIERCIRESKIVQWVPDEVLHATEKTKEELGKLYDKYGDSYTQDVNEDSLQNIFKKISKEEWTSVKVNISSIENLFPSKTLSGLFRGCGGICIASKNKHSTAFEEMDTESKLLHFQLRMHGASLHEDVAANTSHIVIPSHIQSEDVKSLGNFKKDKLQVVTEEWVADCIGKNRLLCEENYKLYRKQ